MPEIATPISQAPVRSSAARKIKSLEELAKVIDTELVTWGRVVKEAGIKGE